MVGQEKGWLVEKWSTTYVTGPFSVDMITEAQTKSQSPIEKV
jgi:hypothetical protein